MYSGGRASPDQFDGGLLGAQPVKILHAISGTANRGTELAFEHTVVALSGHNVVQRVLMPAESSRTQRIRSVGIEVVEVPFRKRLDFASKRRLTSEIGTFEPDLVISWTADVADRVLIQSARHIGYVASDFSSASYHACGYAFALSQQRLDRAVGSGWPTEKIKVLPSIVPADNIVPLNRKTFFTPDTAKLIVAVGQLTPENSFETLIEAVARISGLYLWIVGGGPEQDSLLDKALESGIKPRTRFTGYQDDVLNLVAAADIVVTPARQNDRGEQVLHAWACGKPVIAADSIGPGLLVQHRETGVLVPIDDARSLAEAIKWIKQDSDFAERIAQAGADAFAKSHTADTVVSEYIAYFEDIIARSAPGASDS